MQRVRPFQANQVATAEELKMSEQLVDQYLSRFGKDALGGRKSILSYLSPERVQLFVLLVDLVKDKVGDFKAKRVADVGAGMAYLFKVINDHEKDVDLTAFETFADIEDLANTIAPSAKFVKCSLYDVKETFDIVFCMEVLEHMVDPKKSVEKLMSCLKTGGSLVLTVPDGRYDRQESGNMREDGNSYWGHIHFWGEESWLLFLQKNLPEGYRVETGTISRSHLYAILYPE